METRSARRLQVSSIHVAFNNTPILKGVDLIVEPGEILVLLGPSGCGKTTLLRTIAGLERPDSGTVTIDERTLVDSDSWVPPDRRRIGMVFQDWALFPHLTVARNVAYGLPRDQRSNGRVEQVLATVGLDGFGDRSPATLSGGQQQRVALARALAPQPEVLMLDEPFSNLDTGLRTEVRTEVHRLLTELGITAVFVTHDQEEAFVLGDRIAVMNDGLIQQLALPSEIYTRPASRWIASFVGEVNLVGAQLKRDRAQTYFGDVPLLDDPNGTKSDTIEVLVRPEDLRISTSEDVDQTNGRIELVEYYGHDAMVQVRLDDGTNLRVRTGPVPPAQRGNRVKITYHGLPTTAFSQPGH